MLSRLTTNLYTPSEAAVLSLSTPNVLPEGRCESLNIAHSRHSRKRSHNIQNTHHNHCTSTTTCSNEDRRRRRTVDCGLVRPSLTPRNNATQQVARILPQRIITPGSTTGVRSIWFQSKDERPDFGVSLAGVVNNGVEGFMVAPEERVFQQLSLDYDQIQFSILWPGYGHTSWIASIPINFREESDHQCRPMTRRLLASTVAGHFQAFMVNHSHLRLPHPDPRWKIGNDRENGIRLENLRLTRIFSYKDGTKLSSWQAEILVVGDHPTYPHQCTP